TLRSFRAQRHSTSLVKKKGVLGGFEWVRFQREVLRAGRTCWAPGHATGGVHRDYPHARYAPSPSPLPPAATVRRIGGNGMVPPLAALRRRHRGRGVEPRAERPALARNRLSLWSFRAHRFARRAEGSRHARPTGDQRGPDAEVSVLRRDH